MRPAVRRSGGERLLPFAKGREKAGKRPGRKFPGGVRAGRMGTTTKETQRRRLVVIRSFVRTVTVFKTEYLKNTKKKNLPPVQDIPTNPYDLRGLLLFYRDFKVTIQ